MASHRLKLAGALATLVALVGCWLWIRDSSVFAVQKVTIEGISGAGAPAIRASLEQTARTMSTLHIDLARLRQAVSPYGTVKGLSVSTHLLHGVTIRVQRQPPVMSVLAAGRRLPIGSDGTVLHGSFTGPLASVAEGAAPAGNKIQDGAQLQALELLDIAPAALRDRVARVSSSSGGALGLTAYLRSGPVLYFGDAQRLHAKWAAAARVLSDPTARGARYVDLRVPDRAAAQISDPATLVAAAALTTAKTPGGAP
ncbi:MAG: hypothetical protein NVSMB51_03130 [Solirubrobacteraceae bacterium]